MVGDEIGLGCWGLESQVREDGHFLVSSLELWMFLPGWPRVEVTNHSPSEDICSGDRTYPWDHPHGPLWLLQTPVL